MTVPRIPGILGVDYNAVEVSAWHEAGHAAAVHLLGGTVIWVSIRHSKPDLLKGSTNRVFRLPEENEEVGIVMMAGRAVHTFFEDTAAQNLWKKQAEEEGEQDQDTKAFEDKYGADLVDEFIEKARNLLTDEWELVSAIKDWLMEKPHVTRHKQECDAFFGAWKK